MGEFCQFSYPKSRPRYLSSASAVTVMERSRDERKCVGGLKITAEMSGYSEESKSFISFFVTEIESALPFRGFSFGADDKLCIRLLWGGEVPW